MSNSYIVGKVAKLLASFSVDGTAVDPSTVSMTIRRPDGIRHTYVYGTDIELTRLATGSYRLDYTPVLEGPHWHYWVSTGTAATGGEEAFIVTPAHALE